MGIAYLIMWLMLLPFRLTFHTKLANPGVKILKSKKTGETILKFSNQVPFLKDHPVWLIISL